MDVQHILIYQQRYQRLISFDPQSCKVKEFHMENKCSEIRIVLVSSFLLSNTIPFSRPGLNAHIIWEISLDAGSPFLSARTTAWIPHRKILPCITVGSMPGTSPSADGSINSCDESHDARIPHSTLNSVFCTQKVLIQGLVQLADNYSSVKNIQETYV